MNILVTGGAGFIGNAFTLKAVAEGHTVTVIDNMNSYYDRSLKEARRARLPETVTFVEGDITDRALLTRLCEGEHFDAIGHFAAQAGVRYSLEHPEVYVESNYVGTFTILDVARLCGITKIVMASTSSVYGDDTPTPFVETAPASHPVSIYAATKRGVEILASTYAHLYQMEITALRFFTVYGPWGRPDMALFHFTKQMLAGEQIPVYNNGQMRRDFTYVDDIVDGFYRAVTTSIPGYTVMNIGNGQPVELMDFIRHLESALGVEAKIDFKPMQAGDVHETYADISQAKEKLGYDPKTDIKQGIISFVEWYRSYYQ
ncbi:MAG: SDR family NAD(P)-dependent oxidoreductase [Candidatus Paceibacteria bacterium]